jgi:AbrB family looped-hinge helix DNA binding protein
MSSVTVSPKYQIVIPKDIREEASIKPGSRFEVMYINDCIELVPVIPLKTLRGSLAGIDSTIDRKDDRGRLCRLLILPAGLNICWIHP